MGVRPGYKQTEVGVIPEDWEVRTIGQMFGLVNGLAFKPADWKPTGTPIIRIQNLNDPAADYNHSQSPVPDRNRVEPGDLLFAWSGTLGTSFGARVWSGPSGVLNQHIFKVHMDQEQLTLPFALLVFARIEENIAKQAHGFKASFVHVRKSDLVKVALPLPPLPEQRAIAEALSDVDGLLAALDRLIAKKRDLKQAAMQQLLTGQTRLPGFHDEWEVKRLGDMTMLYQPVTISAHQFSESGYPVYGANGVVGFYRDFNHDSWQVTITCRGSTCGTVNRTVEKCWITGNAMVVNCDQNNNINKEFLCFALKHKDLSVCITGTGQPQIVREPLANVELKIPVVSEQTAIAEVLSDMDAELAALEQRREKTRLLKQAMMQELLTGRTRLVPPGGRE